MIRGWMSKAGAAAALVTMISGCREPAAPLPPAPVENAHPFVTLPASDLITEDVAYSERTRTFFVSSVRKKKVLAVDASGSARDFVPENFYGLQSACALAVVDDRLWVTSAALPPMIGYDPHAAENTGVYAFSIPDGKLVDRVDLPVDGSPHALTDMTAGPDGTLYISDSRGGRLYRLRPGSEELEPLTEVGVLKSPQTPAVSGDGHNLYVADYRRGIARIDLGNHQVGWLSAARGIELRGIDGLYRYGANLIAIQNGTKQPKLVRLVLGEGGGRVTHSYILERGAPGLGEPTHGVFVNDTFYFLANAGWTRFDGDGHLIPNADRDAPALWSLALAPVAR
jgi:hypothetical protein